MTSLSISYCDLGGKEEKDFKEQKGLGKKKKQLKSISSGGLLGGRRKVVIRSCIQAVRKTA